jgi:acyl-CoA thioesterase
MSNKDLTKHIGEDHFAEHVGIVLEVVKPGYARATMKIKPYHLNGVGRVQGGAIYTLADYTFAAAANTEGTKTLGINTTISFYQAALGSILTAEAREVSTQNKICGYDVDVFDETGERVARFSGMGYRKKRTQE